MTHSECELFLEDVLSLGRRFLETGAEVKRVEDTIKRICTAYGFEGPEIYAVTSLIVVTIKSESNEHYTQSVRITKSATDLGQLEELNARARYICENKPDIEEFDSLIKNTQRPKPKPFLKCLGYMLAAGGFAVFFGGNLILRVTIMGITNLNIDGGIGIATATAGFLEQYKVVRVLKVGNGNYSSCGPAFFGNIGSV